jgi:hypothetical protein
MKIIAHKWSGVKFIVAEDMSVAEGIRKLASIGQQKRAEGWDVVWHSPHEIEVTHDNDAGNGGIWRTRPENWAVTSGEPR